MAGGGVWSSSRYPNMFAGWQRQGGFQSFSRRQTGLQLKRAAALMGHSLLGQLTHPAESDKLNQSKGRDRNAKRLRPSVPGLHLEASSA